MPAALIFLLAPLPRYWALLEREYPPVYSEHTTLNFYPADAAVLLLLLVQGFRLLKRPQPESSDMGQRLLTFPLCLLALLTAVSAFTAFDPTLALFRTVRLSLLGLLYLALIFMRPGPKFIQIGMGVAVAGQAAVALLQFVGQDDLGLRRLGELDLNRYPGGGSILAVGGEYYLRGYGLTPHPNMLGGILVVLLLALIPAYLGARGRQKIIWAVVILAGILGVVLSFSRSAWLAAAVGGVFFAGCCVWRPAWREKYGRSIALLALAGTLVLAGFAVWQRDLLLARVNPQIDAGAQYPVETTWTRSTSERSLLTAVALDLIPEHWLLGVGAGNFAPVIVPIAAQTEGLSPQPVHNVPLLLTAELGFLGGLVWVWLMVAPAGLALLRLRRDRLGLWALGLTAALVAFAVVDLLDYYAWGWQQGRLVRWTLWGVWSMSNEQ